MRKERMILAAVATAVFAVSAVHAEVVSEYEIGQFAALTRQIANDDLLHQHPGFNEGVDSFGFVDPWESCLMAGNCNTLGAICNPSEGFHWCCSGDLSDLTDGVQGAATDAVLRDFGRAALIVRYDLEQPTDIGEIVVFAANTDPVGGNNSGRIFQTYFVEVSTDNGDTFTTLGSLVASGEFGVTNNTNNDKATLTRVYDDESDTLAIGVTNLRFIFYCTSNTSGFYIDPWEGVQWEDANWISSCNPGMEVETEDLDGYRKAFEAPIIKEIDVFPPTGEPPFVCNDPVFDVVGGGVDGSEPDGAVDAQDFGIFQACITGPGDPGAIFDTLSDVCKCMDVTGPSFEPDNAISQDDFGVFENCATGPAPGTPVNPACDGT